MMMRDLRMAVATVCAGIALTAWAATVPQKLPPGISPDDPLVVSVKEAQAEVDRLKQGAIIQQLEKLGQQSMTPKQSIAVSSSRWIHRGSTCGDLARGRCIKRRHTS